MALWSLLLKLSFVVWAGSVCLHFRPSVCSVALCSGVSLLRPRFASHFSVVHQSLLFGQRTSVSVLF